MQVDRYRSFLRISVLVAAIVLVFDSGVALPITKELSDNTIVYLANVGSGVGATATVPANEYNELSAQIAKEQQRLSALDEELRAREITSRTYDTETQTDYSTYIMSVILFILTVLLVLNYAMDWARVKQMRYAR